MGATTAKEAAKQPDSFGTVVRDKLIEQGITTRLGHANYRQFVTERLPDVHYETLRKALVGERLPAPDLMEKVAGALKIKPEAFAEYRLYTFSRQFDPREVGMETALTNLRRFGQTGK